MRKALALITAAVAAVALLPVPAVLAQSSLDPQIRPDIEENTAVRAEGGGSQAGVSGVRVGGTAPAGGTVESASFVAIGPNGQQEGVQTITPVILNQGPESGSQYLRVTPDGKLDGRLEVGCLFGPPTGVCPHGEVWRVRLDLTVSGQSASSNLVRVDYVSPFFRGYEVVSQTRILVIFSEPVRNSGGDNPVDWRVEYDGVRYVVTQVTGATGNDCRPDPGQDPALGTTGCTRTLHLSLLQPLPEDARPRVNPRPPANRTIYEDFVDNEGIYTSNFRGIDAPAADLVRPAVPRIDRIAGKTPSDARVVANVAAPTVEVGNLTAGHQVRVVVEPGGQATDFQPVNSDGTATVTLPTLPESPPPHTIRAIARDTNGNLSTETQKNPPSRGDGSPNPVTYILDLTRPRILAASVVGSREIRVALSEVVTPDNHAGQWRVDGQPATASGSGDRRTLTAANDVSGDSVVSWQPSDTTYRDEASNELVPADAIPVIGLPDLNPPTVQEPTGEVYVAGNSVTVRGSVPNATAGLAVDLFDRGSGQPRQSVDVASDGSWSMSVSLPTDGRYEFEVATRHRDSGVRSTRTAVPDIVRDTIDPQIDVTRPAPGTPIINDGNLDSRQRAGVGDNVTVEWIARDDAPNDPENPDHGDTVNIDIVFADGRRDVADGLEHAPNERRQHDYVVTSADLAGAGQREAHFDATLIDLAGNTGSDSSAPILIVGNLVGYSRHFVQTGTSNATIEARFPVALQGTSSATDWRVDGQPPRSAQAHQVDGKTIVTLVASQAITDPNARPEVAYVPSSLDPTRLRGQDGREINTVSRSSIDEISPVLTITAPDAGPRAASATTVTGTTDTTSFPNTVRVFRADASGNPTGSAIATTTAGSDGQFSLEVPLQRNATNRLTAVAFDPSGNSSPARPFTVIEDSAPPVVQITSPQTGAPIPRNVPIRWVTQDAHTNVVDIEYRLNAGTWQRIVAGAVDSGSFNWQLPDNVTEDDVIDIRVVATDAVGHTGSDEVFDLSIGDLLIVDEPTSPITISELVAVGEREIVLRFEATVVLDPAPAGISVLNGPGVVSITGSGTEWTLHLNAPLETTRPLVAYVGRGIRDEDGLRLGAFRATAGRDTILAPTGLVAAAGETPSTVRLSWVDDRNRPADVAGYVVHRNGEEIAEVGPAARSYTDPAVSPGEHTYTVATVDVTGDRVSIPATAQVDTTGPNVTPDGGAVLSDDGQVALLVPPGAVDTAYDLHLEPRAPAAGDGYQPVTGAYALAGGPAGSTGTSLSQVEGLERFDRYVCLSFRGDLGGDRARYTVLRQTADGPVELATRVTAERADACVLTPGTFVLAQTPGETVRVYGPDPAIPADRFATAAGLSQTAFGWAGAAVIARADDYPDALAAAALAEQVGGPVLLARTDGLAEATALELLRLGVDRAILVGGTAALSEQVVADLTALGLDVERVSGPTRFHTAAAVALRVGAFAGQAYLATGLNFADALSASGASARLGRPILLAETDVVHDVTIQALAGIGGVDVTLLGGSVALAPAVEQQLTTAGARTSRVAGSDRYATAAALAASITVSDLFDYSRPIVASGEGDGRTSPDALAAGPVSARYASVLLLVPQETLHPAIEQALRDTAAAVRAVVIAGGPAAISPEVRAALNATQ